MLTAHNFTLAPSPIAGFLQLDALVFAEPEPSQPAPPEQFDALWPACWTGEFVFHGPVLTAPFLVAPIDEDDEEDDEDDLEEGEDDLDEDEDEDEDEDDYDEDEEDDFDEDDDEGDEVEDGDDDLADDDDIFDDMPEDDDSDSVKKLFLEDPSSCV
jgi:hypothetical protein